METEFTVTVGCGQPVMLDVKLINSLTGLAVEVRCPTLIHHSSFSRISIHQQQQSSETRELGSGEWDAGK